MTRCEICESVAEKAEHLAQYVRYALDGSVYPAILEQLVDDVEELLNQMHDEEEPE